MRRFPLESSCANRGFVEATGSGDFAPVGPVLGPPVRARPVSVRSALPGPVRGNFAGTGSPPAHCAGTGPVGAFSQAGPVPEQLAQPARGPLAQPSLGRPAQPAPGRLARAVRARPAPAYHLRSPRIGIASASLQPVADRSRLDSDRRVQELQQFRRARACRLQSAADPQCPPLIELLTSMNRCQTEAPACRPTKPQRSQGGRLDFPSTEPRYRSPSPL